MHGLTVPSFLPMKKNPAPKGDVDEQIMPAARDSLCFSMLSLSGLDMLNKRQVGRGAPERRSIAQTYVWWDGRGRERASDLLKTMWMSWYSDGTLMKSAGWETTGRRADWRHEDKQSLLQESTDCSSIQGVDYGGWVMDSLEPLETDVKEKKLFSHNDFLKLKVQWG